MYIGVLCVFITSLLTQQNECKLSRQKVQPVIVPMEIFEFVILGFYINPRTCDYGVTVKLRHLDQVSSAENTI